jgi:magnesium transporter
MPDQDQLDAGEAQRGLRLLDPTDDIEQIHSRCASGQFCWLDLDQPDERTVQKVGEALGLHPLAIEDTQEFEQRPKVDVHDDQLLLVYYGAVAEEAGGLRLVEVHLHITQKFVLTVHREAFPRLTELHAKIGTDSPEDQQLLIYRVIDLLTDSLLDVLDDVTDTVSEQSRNVFHAPRASDRDRMAHLLRSIDRSRRIVALQRQVFDRMISRLDELPVFREDLRPNYADISDHLWRAVDDMQTATDSVHATLDQYSNAVQERLTIVATIFLPLSLLTGFFGQNFNWLITHIGSAWTFWGLGVGGLIVAAAGIWAWLVRSGMYDRPGKR